MQTYVLNPKSKTPLYEQLYAALKNDILSGAIRAGEKLPSKRALAEHLSVSCITVENAYNQLLTEGYLFSRPRSGYYAETIQTVPNMRREPAAPQPRTVIQPPSPSASQFPFSIWARLMRGVLLDCHDDLLSSPPNTGMVQLRQAIAGMLRRSRGMEVDPDCIVVGAGAEYFYNILIQLLGRENHFGIENPGHQKLRQVYRVNGVRICPIALDDNGVSMEALRQSDATVLHISPSHQYPTGLVTPIGRRSQIMAWLGEEPNRWVVEDDYDSEFRFEGRVIPTMYAMDTIGRVIYINTFSKTITPALRISYMILPPDLMALYRQKLGFYSCTVPGFEQLTLARFLDEGYFEKHVSRMRRHYRLLRDRFWQLLKQSPQASKMTIQGYEAGLHFLLKLDSPLSDRELEQRLAENGIRAAALETYETGLPTETVRGRMVISYSELEEAELPRVMALLEQLVQG